MTWDQVRRVSTGRDRVGERFVDRSRTDGVRADGPVARTSLYRQSTVLSLRTITSNGAGPSKSAGADELDDEAELDSVGDGVERAVREHPTDVSGRERHV
jgi:hypothetical protein